MLENVNCKLKNKEFLIFPRTYQATLVKMFITIIKYVMCQIFTLSSDIVNI